MVEGHSLVGEHSLVEGYSLVEERTLVGAQGLVGGHSLVEERTLVGEHSLVGGIVQDIFANSKERREEKEERKRDNYDKRSVDTVREGDHQHEQQ